MPKDPYKGISIPNPWVISPLFPNKYTRPIPCIIVGANRGSIAIFLKNPLNRIFDLLNPYAYTKAKTVAIRVDVSIADKNDTYAALKDWTKAGDFKYS